MRPSAADVSRSTLSQFVALLVCGVLLSCSNVKANDFTGNWAMTDQSRRYLAADLRNTSPTITLNSDGTFAAVDLPKQRRFDSDIADVAISGRGRWSILRLGGRDSVQLSFEDNSGHQLFISDWTLNGPWSPTTLYYHIGDPDSVRRIQFARA